MTSQINPPDRQEVQQILLALSHSLQNVSCNSGFPSLLAALLLTQGSISVAYSLSPTALQQPFFLHQYLVFKTDGQVVLCLLPHWGTVFCRDKRWPVSSDMHWEECHTERNRRIIWIRCFSVFLIRSIL